MAEESTSAATAPWPFVGLKTIVTFCAAGGGITARELSAGVEFVWALVDVRVPLAATAALGTIVEANGVVVGLDLSAEGEEDDEDEGGKSAACSAAGASVFPSSWPSVDVGRITPVSASYMNTWLPVPCSVGPGEV